MRRLRRLYRLNESRDSEIRMLADNSWSEIKNNLNDLFASGNDLYKNGWSLCEIVNQYLREALEKEPFFKKSIEIDYYDAVSDYYAGTELKYSDTRTCVLFNEIDVKSDSLKVSIYTRIRDTEELEFITRKNTIVSFEVAFDRRTSTVSNVIESVLNELDNHISKIISSVTEEIISLNGEPQITRLEKLLKSNKRTCKNESVDAYLQASSDTIAAWDNLIDAYLMLADVCDDSSERALHLSTARRLRELKRDEFPNAI